MDNLDKKLESISTYLIGIAKEVYQETGVAVWNIYNKDDTYRKAADIVKEKLNGISLTPDALREFIKRAVNHPSSLRAAYTIVLTEAINKISADNPNKVIELKDFYDPSSYLSNYLLAGARNVKVKGTEAGCCLGHGAENSQIYFKKAGNEAGYLMKNSTLILEKAGDDVGKYACCSRIDIKREGGAYVGSGIRDSYIVVGAAGNFLGAYSVNTKVIADIIKGSCAGYAMENGELNADLVLVDSLDCFGCFSKNSILRVNIVEGANNIGGFAEGTTIYIYKITDLSYKTISLDFFEDSRNVLYVGPGMFNLMKKIPEYNKYIKRGNIGVWEEEDRRKWRLDLKAKIEESKTIDIS